jgi:predicted DNA-binding protein
MNHYLPGQSVKALQALAKKTGLPVAEHIRRAVEAYLKEMKKS